MEKSFLIIGAGEVGLAMLNSLYDYQEKHTEQLKIGVVVRPLESSMANVKNHSKFIDLIVEPLDLIQDNQEQLIAAFKKYDTVICCSGFATGNGMQVKITNAVLEAGVRRYVPWQFGVDYDRIGKGSAQPSFDEQLEVRNLLRAQQHTHWIIVSTGMFTSFLFREDFGVISLANQTVNALGDWYHSLTLTACEDIGNLTIEILFQQPEILDQVVFIAGDTLTFEQIHSTLEKHFATTFERKLLDIHQLEKEAENDPENVFNRYRLVFTHAGVTWPMAQTFNVQNNIPVTDVESWLKKNILKK